jgi:putative transposase
MPQSRKSRSKKTGEWFAVEDLDTKEMLESPGNSHNTASAAWNTFTSMLETKCKREGTPVETALPTGTTVVPAKRVVEPGNPCLTEPPKAASRQG